ncbi:MAG: DegT/DnrJ/EryC1/StrS family aminotransferase [archaeon]
MRDLIRINQPQIGKEEIDAVTAVLKSGVLSNKSGAGPKVLELERAFASSVGVKHAVAVSSGTTALHAALLACDVKPGDEVLLPSFTFVGTATPVLLCEARPVFCDIDAATYCMSPDALESVIGRKTRVIVVVHLYGLPCDMDPILELARKRGITLIEDACQAQGGIYKKRKVGSIGEMGCFSFSSDKIMTTGEGGMVTTNDDELAHALRSIRTQGEERPNWINRLGSNFHMTEVAAAIGTIQLAKVPSNLQRRRENAEFLTSQLKASEKLETPMETEDRIHSWHLYTVTVKGANAGKRNKIVEKLRNKNIEASVYYETPIHLLPLYRDSIGGSKGMLPETERAARRVIQLPIQATLGQEELDYVADNLTKAVGLDRAPT